MSNTATDESGFPSQDGKSVLYRHPFFLDPADCVRVRRGMDEGTPEEAEILGDLVQREEAVRRALTIDVAPELLAEVEARLDGVRAAVAAFFGSPLDGREGCGFVRYGSGGFYRPHRDRADVPSWPDAARRAVAVVLFLNGDFEGGLLRLFAEETIEVTPRAGLLVAFPADLLHEVTVVRGTRDAIVDWFYAP
jgi:predicted 2-oxoglutarate/Fe(II)-dependent dioxygenase YbiX